MSRPASALIAVALCATSQRIDAWSRPIVLLALAAAALPAPSPLWLPTLCVLVACGLLQLFWALRLAFDQPVFAAWSRADADPQNLAAFDAALAELGVGKPISCRDLPQRLAGVRRLFRRQLLAFAGQLAATFTALFLLLSV